MIQRDSGGNLAELLDKISAIVRERLKLHGEVRTLSAEGRLSAYILTALPFAVALVVHFTNPRFMAVLWTDPTGMRMVGAALVMMVLGVWWMRQIIRIRV
jgi:tight adherence protein B